VLRAHPRRRPFDTDKLLALARESFVRLQAAWDRGDERTLAAIATAPLMDDLRRQLRQRGPGPHRTEVLSVEAQLLGVEELREAYVASVEFSGLMRENDAAAASPFRELWLLAEPKGDGARRQGWRLAGVQALG
jgi:predicted lipid-binding transport protein (Tim44 family)